MLSPSDIKGIAAKCKEMSDEGWSDALASEVVGDIPALLSHIEALEERLRKAGDFLRTTKDHTTNELLLLHVEQALAELSPPES